MNKEDKNIEDLFKDKFEDFEADINPSVWKNVQTGLKGAGLGILIKTAINKLGTNAIVAIVSSAATVLSTVVVMNWGTNENKTAENKHTTTPKTTVEIPKASKPEEIKNFLSNDNSTAKKNDVKVEVPLVEKTTNDAIKKDKNEMQSVINAFSDQSVAAINASTIGGAVPLIVSLSNTGNGKINKWDFGNGKKETNTNPVAIYDVPGIYTVVLTSMGADGKTATDHIKIEVTGNSSLTISDEEITFSPNGDSIKDIFIFQSTNIVDMKAMIFDAKANVVKNIHAHDGIDGKWDGTNEAGKPAKEGSYFYILNAVGVDGKKYDKKGKINLTR